MEAANGTNATNATKPKSYGPRDQTQHEKTMEIMGHTYDSINKNGWNYNSPWKSKNPYHEEPKASNKSADASACVPAGNGTNGSNATAGTCGNASTNASGNATAPATAPADAAAAPAEAAALLAKNVTFTKNDTNLK